MSRGPGRIERAIRELFDAHPDLAFVTDELVEHCYPEAVGAIERKHQVAVLRAAKNAIKDDLDWDWRIAESQGGPVVFYNRASGIAGTSQISLRRIRRSTVRQPASPATRGAWSAPMTSAMWSEPATRRGRYSKQAVTDLRGMRFFCRLLRGRVGQLSVAISPDGLGFASAARPQRRSYIPDWRRESVVAGSRGCGLPCTERRATPHPWNRQNRPPVGGCSGLIAVDPHLDQRNSQRPDAIGHEAQS